MKADQTSTHASVGSRSASASAALSSSSCGSCDNTSSSSSSEQLPNVRQRLQRGAKDKVYAVRLAANDQKCHSTPPPWPCAGETIPIENTIIGSLANKAAIVHNHQRNQSSPSTATSCARHKGSSSSTETAAEVQQSNFWPCCQCTCLNSKRRKHCQACGIPRYLMVHLDGTFKINELCSSTKNTDDDGSVGETKSYRGLCNTNISNNNPIIFSQEEESNYHWQQKQLLAIMDAPVITRSKRREQCSQTQLSQSNESELFTYHSSTQNSFVSRDQHEHQQQQQQEQLPQIHEKSEFQQWIRKRHTAKREKRKRVPNNNVDVNTESALLGKTMTVTIRCRAFSEDGSMPSVHHWPILTETDANFPSQHDLKAYIPIKVVAKISSLPRDSIELASSNEIKRVTVRIRDSIENASESSNELLTAYISVSILSRIPSGTTRTSVHNNAIEGCNHCMQSTTNDPLPKGKIHHSRSSNHPDANSSLSDETIILQATVASVCSQVLNDIEHSDISIHSSLSSSHDKMQLNDRVQMDECFESDTTLTDSLRIPPDEGETPENLAQLSKSGPNSNCVHASPLKIDTLHELTSKDGERLSETLSSKDQQSSQSSRSVESSFMPMTQQLLDFGYSSQFSQTSIATPTSDSIGEKQIGEIRTKVNFEEKVSPSFAPTIYSDDDVDDRSNIIPDSVGLEQFYSIFEIRQKVDDPMAPEQVINVAMNSLGFATAGNRAVMTVSDEHPPRVTQLLVTDAVNSSCTPVSNIAAFDAQQTCVGFSTAGSGALIKISEESLRKARCLLGDREDHFVDQDGKSFDERKIELLTSHMEHKSSSCLERIHSASKNAVGTCFGFTTAGSGVTIRVSDESLSRASRLLTECKADHDNYFAPQNSIDFSCANNGVSEMLSDENTLNSTKCIEYSMICSDRALKRVDKNTAVETFESDGEQNSTLRDPGQNLDSFSFTGFRTAGTDALIQISDECLARGAIVVMGCNEDPNSIDLQEVCSPSSDGVHPSIVSRALSGKNIPSTDGRAISGNDKANPVESSLVLKCQAWDQVFSEWSGNSLGFTCAGSGSVIQISNESLNKASKLLAKNSEDYSGVRANLPHRKRGDTSNETYLSNSNDKTNLSPMVPMGFTSAGSGSLIQISEESLIKASSLFHENEACYAMKSDNDYDCVNDDYHPSKANTKTIAETTSHLAAKASGFTSAGSGSTIKVSTENLFRASKLLTDIDNSVKDEILLSDEEYNDDDDSTRARATSLRNASKTLGFASAGSGALLHVSNESLSRALTVLDVDNDAGLLFGNKRDESIRPCEDFSNSTISKHRKDSIHPSFRAEIVVGIPPYHVEGQTQKNHKVRFSLDAITHAEGLKSFRNKSIITPDNRRIAPPREVESGIYQYMQEQNRPANERNNIERISHTPCLRGTKNQAKVVTDLKDSNTKNDDSSQRKYTRTPLHDKANVLHDPLQSVMKSKRLFQSNSSECDRTEKISFGMDSIVGRSTINKAALNGVFSLGQFASIHHATQASSWEDCIKYGVRDVTMRVTSVNATKLRFGSNDGLPLFFLGQRDPPKCSHVGTITDISEWLSCQGCDKSLITDKWILNHVRWIVWKLAATERRFPIQLGGQYLTYSHVLSQIKGRYKKEIRDAKRPAVRKLLNRDVSACIPIVLCVSQVLRYHTKQREGGNGGINSGNNGNIRLELSDGWYAICAILDDNLVNLIDDGRIRVGSKLMICNAQLVGSDDGVDPLDESYSSEKRNCPIYLKISSNNSRLARWDVKLGFLHPKYTLHQGGGILVKSLSDIFPDGGNIPAIDVIICKRYPQMFLEQLKDARTEKIATNHLTETEEVDCQNEYDSRLQRNSEHYAENAHRECSEEIDDDAPTEWKEMNVSISPEDYYENLTATAQNIIDDWTKKRQLLLQSNIAKRVEDSVKDHCRVQRTSVPYLRILVKSFDHSPKGPHQVKRRNSIAELTVWRVTEDQRSLLKEGTVVRMKNLAVKSGKHGILQLSATSETNMEYLPSQPTQIQLIRSGYEMRQPKSLMYINLMANKFEPSHLTREVDVVACIVKIQRIDSKTTAAYLTDESGFVMKLIRTHTSNHNDPFQMGNIETSLPTVVELCNVFVSSFDTKEHCAIGTWGLFTCKARNSLRFRHEEIQDWCNSYSGLKYCSSIIDRINAGLPACAAPFNRCAFCIGYVLGFALHETASLDMNVIVDYGEEFPLTARFPTHLLTHLLRLTQNNSPTGGCVGLSSILNEYHEFNYATTHSTCGMLSEYFQQNQVLFHFSLEKASCYGVELQLHEVTGVSIASVDSLCRLHLVCGARKYALGEVVKLEP